MSDSSRRRLKCSCGERVAQMWSCYFGAYLFIHCPACNRKLQSESFHEALYVTKDKKAIKRVQDKLSADWKAGL